jgi:hypothetical protein
MGLGDEDTLLRRYLLGDLTDAERERAEDRLLRDATVLDELDEVEDDLTEAYLGGSLSPRERTQFEGHFLQSAAHRRQLEASRALRGRFTAGPATANAGSTRSWKAALAAAAVVILVLAAAALWWRSQVPTGRPDSGPQARSAPPLPVPSDVAPRPTQTADREVVLGLMPGRTMAADGRRPEARLGPATVAVRLELVLDQGRLGGCQARLSAAGREVWRQEGCEPLRTPDGSIVVVKVPASLLQPSTDYRVDLFAAAGEGEVRVGTYWFRVSRPLHSP